MAKYAPNQLKYMCIVVSAHGFNMVKTQYLTVVLDATIPAVRDIIPGFLGIFCHTDFALTLFY
jgi:hypothetical protein